MSSAPPLPTAPWRAHWPVAALVLGAAVVALWSKAAIFPDLSWNRDEPVYLWQMEVLRSGRLAAPDGGHPDLFLPWLSAARDGELFGQYTIGWPLVLLLADVVVGTPTAALALGAALAVGGTYALAYELTRRRAVATAAGALLLASPIVAVQGGVHLAYLFTLGLGLLFGALLLSGVRLASTPRLVGAGVLLGWILLTRPYDAVVWGAVFGLHALLVDRARWRPTLARLALAAAGTVPFVLTTLLVNQRLTGSPLEFAMTVKDPLDTFGFGERRLMPSFVPVDYGPGSALRSSAKNALFFPWFLAGSYVTVLVAVLATWWGRRGPHTWLLVALGAAFPLTYLPFWGTYLSSLASRISGPIYLIPLYAPVCILVAGLLVHWWEARRAAVVAVVAALGVATVPFAWDRLALNQEISRHQAGWHESLEDIEEPALVLVADTTYLLYANPFSANPPGLDGPRLYAALRDPEVLELIAAEPERAIYVQAATEPASDIGPREDPVGYDVAVERGVVHRGEELTLVVEARVPPGAGAAQVRVRAGAIDERWELLGTGTRRRIEIPLHSAELGPGPGRIVVSLGWGADVEGAAHEPDVRLVLLSRVADGQVEVLDPPLAQQLVTFDDGRQEWWHAPTVPGLTTRVADPAP